MYKYTYIVVKISLILNLDQILEALLLPPKACRENLIKQPLTNVDLLHKLFYFIHLFINNMVKVYVHIKHLNKKFKITYNI